PVEILDASNILKKEFIYSQYLDDAGHLWLATDNGVTMLLLNYPLVHYNEESGIIGTVESVKQIDGVTYVVTREGLFYSNKSYSISPYFNKAGNFNLESWDIIRCRNMEPAKLLLSTTQGVFALDKDHNQTLIIDRTVKILHRGIKDPTKIYAGRNDGLSVLTYDGRWKETSLIDDLEGPVLTVSEDKEGDIWFGTIADAVVYRIQNNLEEPLVKKYDRANGLSEGSTVTAIYGEDVIIGTAKGIFKYSANNDRFILDERFNVIPDYEEIGYHRIHIGDNRIWLETILLNGNLAPGFVSITDGEFEWIVDPFKPISYDIIHAFYDGGDEGALIGGSDGLFRYHADFEKNYDRPFYTIIRKVEILGDSISYHNVASNSSTQVLPYLLNSMTFSFASVYFEGKDKILYQFKMKGYDREWSDWVKEPSRTYTNLAEGNYQFMVRSKNLYEKISTTATFNFKILPPWNRTWWFYMLGTVIVIALLWSYYTIRVTNKSLKQSQQIIAKQNYKLIDANQQLSDFAQLISHDLKAPLRGIANVATWLRKDHGESLDKKGTELMETMENRVNKMQKLISDVLEYSRQTNSKSNEETFDIGKLTRELIELNSPPDNISVQIDGTLPTVSADKVQLSIILENLISNAIKYNDKPQGRINIGTKKIRSAVFLYVKDNGPGIEARYHDKIFQMFQTLNRKDGYESTGIGLAMVKKIIDKNEGKIWIESEIGKGSTFYFSIPKVVNQ
ncbi:MAG: GHKL domain-containing protein, partial [Bacteroidetes bacterium]|nr:GHKL domain-containing protein [Bacteroidota bacterium]